jgi:hypothetical protein
MGIAFVQWPCDHATTQQSFNGLLIESRPDKPLFYWPADIRCENLLSNWALFHSEANVGLLFGSHQKSALTTVHFAF